MWYNPELFEENNWTYPETYEDFKAICADAKAKGLIPVAFGSSGFNRINEWWLSSAISSYSSTEELNRLLKGELKFADPEIKGGFEEFLNCWNNGWISNSDSFAVSYEDARSLFTQGRAPFIMEGTWYYQTLMDTGMDFGVELLPPFKDGKTPVFPTAVSRIMAVNKDTEHKDAVLKFIDFMLTNEEAYINSTVIGNNQPLPINVDLREHTSEMEPKMAHITNLMLDAQEEGNIGYCLWTFFPQNTRIYLYEKLDGVLLKEISLEQYLEEAQAILDADIEQGNVPSLE